MDNATRLTAFAGDRLLVQGNRSATATTVRDALARDPALRILVFDGDGRQVDLDMRLEAQPPAEAAPPARGRGRPRLGVQSREITLLPRQWEWLSSQPGGASAALRRLVEAAERADATRPGSQRKSRQEAAYRFLMAMAGDRPGYEEVLRALFAGDRETVAALAANWPGDIGRHALALLDDE